MQEINSPSLRERVEKRVKGRKQTVRWVFFIVSLIVTLIFTGIAWGVAASDPAIWETIFREDSAGALVLIFPTLAGFMSLLYHFLSLAMDSGMGERQMRAQILTEELGQSLLEDQLREVEDREKRKRDAARLDADAVTINDEGELVPLDETQDEQHRTSR
jgi:hypothetical protein